MDNKPLLTQCIHSGWLAIPFAGFRDCLSYGVPDAPLGQFGLERLLVAADLMDEAGRRRSRRALLQRPSYGIQFEYAPVQGGRRLRFGHSDHLHGSPG